MGGAPSFMPLFIITIILIHPNIANATDNIRETSQISKLDRDDDNGGIATISPTVSTHNYDHDHQGKKSKALKPSIVIVVCVLTSVCSITFMILLYIKHCIRGNTSSTSRNLNNSSEERKNSGVERSMVESLPIFRFGSLRGQKEGLECAICLKRFEDHELLRLLPKCNHAFHVECVDMWLNEHSTCPLCRDKVDLEDIVLIDQQQLPPPSLIRHQSNAQNEGFDINTTPQPLPRPQLHNPNQVMSRRHSWVGKSDNGIIEISLEDIEETSSHRRSLDDSVVRRIEGKRKDGKLATHENKRSKKREKDHRLEHRIIVSSPTTKSSQCPNVYQKRWSNIEPCDLLCLTPDMIISENYTRTASSSSQQQHQNRRVSLPFFIRNQNVEDEMEKGGMNMNMNMRTVSETTGMNGNRGRGRGREREKEEERQEGAIKRWLAWISKTHSQ
ncbi:hypothetical protein TanjilG_12853 [Lupinus angustifolius]|uniref:RING-type E3 ubiquitin transferase n=1 Tax=Lupinus angustifolius TaxID=3871 RepID=A0A1J7HQ18_LUPAN|nr:PREDICTED: RING-H2 finger protein ATL43-like [Lupinus angustifolius]OIW02539.1 hypothetical protein TanjilG_12853 [Lupinus angustifolius]